MNDHSFDLFVVFDYLVELTQLAFLVLVEFSHYQILSVDAVAHLLLKLLQSSLHPVTVVLSRLHAALSQLPLDVSPYFPHFEVRVHLNNF